MLTEVEVGLFTISPTCEVDVGAIEKPSVPLTKVPLSVIDDAANAAAVPPLLGMVLVARLIRAPRLAAVAAVGLALVEAYTNPEIALPTKAAAVPPLDTMSY
jgi:hypothetical protein